MMLPPPRHHLDLRALEVFRTSLLDFVRQQHAVKRCEEGPSLFDLRLLGGEQFFVFFLTSFVLPIPVGNRVLPGIE